ncbi:MAG: TIGR04211 family SH3 domain-containing protein [Thermodesulfobacteriota bacterium]
MNIRKVCCLMLLFLFLGTPALAQTLYVSDQFQITLRTGPSQEHRIISMLPTGTKLQVLQTLPEWVQVRTPEGKQGWVLKRYTMQRVPREQEISQLQATLQRLQEQAGSNQVKSASLQKNKMELQANLQKLERQLQDLEQKHRDLQRDAGNIEGIKQELQRSKTALELNREQVNKLRQENQELSSRKNLYWFLAGGGTFAFAGLLGFFLGRTQRKKSKKVYF